MVRVHRSQKKLYSFHSQRAASSGLNILFSGDKKKQCVLCVFLRNAVVPNRPELFLEDVTKKQIVVFLVKLEEKKSA